ncbi:putative phd-finger domain-containing protein [Phaeoacremonium minimum UCRPA7]|uniref:Putative phd-finger domain-containing protein n=1 Tax=Phaeoacremonium minimum (strain UCR-PA7) TaxID=1286976 RepID=R8BXK4_PHAM7|nr:putative phd-finger domain-containing protein [Phaeoacremonium minimum UCRPA7]EOO04131.1 putative phd-finger domain-containing protein [Phaeoacremonium minimum UCRPA7]
MTGVLTSPASTKLCPVFQTPKNHQGHFDDPGGWTPRFAEEYSVFNSTPGNLRGSQGPFVDFGSYQSSGGHKRQFSAEGFAVEIAAHVNHFSPNPNLPPVDPSRRLASSSDHTALSPEQVESEQQGPSQERSVKKPRRSIATKELQGQTATPPPSAKKGERKLAPKLKTDNMQNDQGYGQPDFAGTPQQPHINTFVTTPSDVFGYPMSAPATAPAFTNTRPFWDTEFDASMGMDMDFGASADVFQTPTPSHRGLGSMDWGRPGEMFQDASMVPQQNQENMQPARRERQIAPKNVITNLETDQAQFVGTYPTPIDDPFGIGPGDGVNPGLLFSRPPSSSMESAVYNPMQPPSSSAPAAPQSTEIQQRPATSKAPMRNDLRRSASVREIAPSKQFDRASFISPVKSSMRPGLSRSFSENRGKRPLARSSLPALAPAPVPMSRQGGDLGSNRVMSNGPRPTGRTSPLKNHQRLSSLSSIPETGTPRPRPSVKFTIDANGRAHAETTLVVDDEPAPPPSSNRRGQNARPLHKAQWDSSDDDSSTDDEPIIIPSRNTSFTFPDPHLSASKQNNLHAQQRSFSERSVGGFSMLPGELAPTDPESEAETIMNEMPQEAGDAASELRKVMQTRQRGSAKKPKSGASTGRRQRFMSSSASFGAPPYHANSIISPTTLTDNSLPTPSSDRVHSVRCVCNRHEAGQDSFMVQCESCEYWLHGRCINITKRNMPSVYICAFCANTPNMRGGRIRDTGRGPAVMGHGGGSATSPLAHKSFRSFR